MNFVSRYPSKALTIAMLVLATLANSNSSFAGREGGNGGAVVVCPNKHIPIELYDYYEARKLRKMPIDDSVSPNTTTADVVIRTLSKMKESQPERWKRYMAFALQILADIDQIYLGNERNTRWVAFVDRLPQIDDAGAIRILPEEGCLPNTQQLVIQAAPEYPEDRLLTISRPLWTRMNPVNRAGAIIHEIIYQEAIALGHKTSKQVRYFNAHLASPVFSAWTQVQVIKMLQLIGFPYEYDGTVFGTDGKVLKHSSRPGPRSNRGPSPIEWTIMPSEFLPWDPRVVW